MNTTPDAPVPPPSLFRETVVGAIFYFGGSFIFGIAWGFSHTRSAPGYFLNALISGGFFCLVMFAVLGQHGGRGLPRIIRDSRKPLLALLAGAASIIGVIFASMLYGAELKARMDRRAQNQLGIFRAAFDRYLAANDGRRPDTLEILVAAQKYLSAIPPVDVPVWTPKDSDPDTATARLSHSRSTAIYYGTQPNDAGGWLYDGSIRINCTHTDLSGKVWASY